jgi:hypothetical protein
MKTTKKTLIATETHEAVSIRLNFRTPARPERCAVCATAQPMLTPEEAARLAGLSVRAVCRLVEASRVHFAETPDGLLLVCPSALMQQAQEYEEKENV